MRTLTAKYTNDGLGHLINLARAEPMTIANHGRPVVVVMSVDEYERLTASGNASGSSSRSSGPARQDAEPSL